MLRTEPQRKDIALSESALREIPTTMRDFPGNTMAWIEKVANKVAKFIHVVEILKDSDNSFIWPGEATQMPTNTFPVGRRNENEYQMCDLFVRRTDGATETQKPSRISISW